MDRLRKARTPLRTQLTRMVNQVTQVLQTPDPDKEELQVNLQDLHIIWNALGEADTKVIDQLLDDDADELAIEAEHDVVAMYRRSYLNIKLKLTKILEPSVSPPGSSYSEAASHVSERHDKKKSFKLPKIQLMKFNGELRNWLAWWSQFSKINDDEDMDDSDKFQYLINAMEDGTEAKEIALSYPQSGENYNKAVEALKSRYGREDLQLQFYVRELLNLVMTNVTKREKLPLPSLFLKLQSHLRSLSTLKLDKADPATWLFPLVESSLSEETLRAWQRSPISKSDGSLTNPPKSRLDFLMEFLEGEVRTEQQIDMAQNTFQSVMMDEQPRNKGKGKAAALKKTEDIATAAGLMSANIACAFCGGKHDSDRCVKAQSMSISDKKEKIDTNRLCSRCLKPGHFSKRCKAFLKCIICGGRHYPIMCQGERKENNKPGNPTPPPADTIEDPNSNVTYSSSTTNLCNTDVLLNILLVNVTGEKGTMVVRVVGDTGSQRSYVRQKVVKEIGLKPVAHEWIQNVLFGGGTSQPTRSGRFPVPLSNLNGQHQETLQLLERQEICGSLPKVPNGPWITELEQKGIKLSDIGSGCADVDILIGSDYWGQLQTGRMIKLRCGLVAQETVFGWTVSGRVPYTASNLAVTTTSSLISATTDITNLWSLEAIGILDPIEVQSKEEEEAFALQHFQQNVSRESNGRYTVALPWKESNCSLPTNRIIAERRLKRVTQQLIQRDKFAAYDELFRGWEQEGLITTIINDIDEGHFLPHRPVYKDSATTPVRPVFDASCKSGKFPSLNDCLYKGPNLLELIPSLLIRFREHPIGVSADIRKAFQMIGVRREDQIYQKFLWWTDATCTVVKVYQHLRVVFGLNCSPFLLAATLHYHFLETLGDTNEAKQLTKQFYVDNLVTSVKSTDEYENLKLNATSTLASAGMELRQWTRNHKEGDKTTDEDEDICLSVLGMIWNRHSDSLTCVIPENNDGGNYTKKMVLSLVARIFDPIGILAPALIPLKQLIQESWTANVGWDEILPEESQKKIGKWLRNISLLNHIRVPRHFQLNSVQSRELHVFVDASFTAYAAVVFLRSTYGMEMTVQLILAKSRLSPSKRTKQSPATKPTIPRLELMACVIGTRLATTVKEALNFDNDVQINFWSDSTTALAWIRRHDHWGAFVGNRVKEIRETTSPSQWRHIPGNLNPADLPSRGCDPKELYASTWWEGPDWLKQDKSTWPNFEEDTNEEEVSKEKRKTPVLIAIPEQTPRFSSYRKNVAVWGWVKRFIKNCRVPSQQRLSFPYLTIEELRKAEPFVIKLVQNDSFKTGETKIGGLRVFKHEDGLLRVQTRLTARKDTAGFLNPILLPKNHPIVEFLILDLHRFYGHAGVQFLMSKSREKYWIIQTRRTIRRVLRTCSICRRHQSKPFEVTPSQLPERRVNTSEPFQTTGVDLFGPLYLKDGSKVWVVLFTCAYYRCVYLDPVSSLSTEAFLGSLERFIGLYGRPNTVYSDNGTNFHGAANLFKDLNWKEVEEGSNLKQINWIFNPPSAAWYGGFWERLIRSIKDLLKRILGTSKLNFDEIRTCLVGVCATINDRPLTVVTEDNGDLIPLTPAMFLRRNGLAITPETLDSISLQKGYLRMKVLQQQLQERFRKEYLSLLVQRGNPARGNQPKEGDVVLVGADNKKRFQWPLGVIVELIPGRDGEIRNAKIKTTRGILVRPLQRLYPMEVSCSDVSALKQAHQQQKVVTTNGVKAPEVKAPQRIIVTKRGRVVQSPARYGQWRN